MVDYALADASIVTVLRGTAFPLSATQTQAMERLRRGRQPGAFASKLTVSPRPTRSVVNCMCGWLPRLGRRWWLDRRLNSVLWDVRYSKRKTMRNGQEVPGGS